MSMFKDIVWDAKGNDEICVNSKIFKQYARGFFRGHWSFVGPGSEKQWHKTYDQKPDGSWDRTVAKMLLTFAERDHSVVPCSEAGLRLVEKLVNSSMLFRHHE